MEEEKAYLRDIQKLIGEKIPVINEHPFMDDVAPAPDPNQQEKQQRRPQRRNNNWKGGRNKNRGRNSK
jgi:ATP-dependent RNA helicase RhlE